MKKMIMAATLTIGALTLAACNDNADSEPVVETAAGDITKEEFYQELKDQHGEQVLEQMITMKVLEDNYEVTDEQVEAELEKTKEQYGEGFEAALQQSGFADEEAYKELIYLSLLQEAALTEGIEVTDEEIQEKYDRMGMEVDAQHILVADEETAKEVKSKLDEGEDFAELVAEYSMDPGSAQDEGNLGYFGTGVMNNEFETAAFNLEVGEISEPVQSPNGYHIIKVNDKRETEEEVGEFEDMKDDIRRDLLTSKIDMATAQEKIDKLIEDADLDIKIEEFEGLFDKEEAQG